MKQFIEFVPLILFFVVYQMNGETIEIAGWSHTVDGIYSATKALMAATLINLPIIWLLAGELEKRLIWTSVAVFVFGGATLAFNNELFIQWKPTVFNWSAIAFTLFIMVITMLVMAPWLKSEKMAPDTGSEQDSH